MKFDIFCEIQKAKPWPKDHEAVLFRETMEQARPPTTRASIPGGRSSITRPTSSAIRRRSAFVLTAIAARTQRIHVGHAGVLAPFRINNPYQVAERAATLDLLSDGRLELGLAKSGGKEWETFGVNPETARDQVREALHGHSAASGRKSSARARKRRLRNSGSANACRSRCRSRIPRFWQTCGSPESFFMAGELGVGALGTTLLSPVSFMGQMLDDYRRGLKACKQPVGTMLNDEKGVFTFVHVAESRVGGDQGARGVVGALVRQRRADRVQGAARGLVRRHPLGPPSERAARHRRR